MEAGSGSPGQGLIWAPLDQNGKHFMLEVVTFVRFELVPFVCSAIVVLISILALCCTTTDGGGDGTTRGCSFFIFSLCRRSARSAAPVRGGESPQKNTSATSSSCSDFFLATIFSFKSSRVYEEVPDAVALVGKPAGDVDHAAHHQEPQASGARLVDHSKNRRNREDIELTHQSEIAKEQDDDDDVDSGGRSRSGDVEADEVARLQRERPQQHNYYCTQTTSIKRRKLLKVTLTLSVLAFACYVVFSSTELMFLPRVYKVRFGDAETFPTVPERWRECTAVEEQERTSRSTGGILDSGSRRHSPSSTKKWRWDPETVVGPLGKLKKPPLWIFVNDSNYGIGKKICKQTAPGVNLIVKKCLESFERHLRPHFEFVYLNEKNITKFLDFGDGPGLLPRWHESLPEGAQYADFASLSLQYRYGGAYVDWDVLLLNNINPYWDLLEHFETVLIGPTSVRGYGTAYDEHGLILSRPRSLWAESSLRLMLQSYADYVKSHPDNLRRFSRQEVMDSLATPTSRGASVAASSSSATSASSKIPSGSTSTMEKKHDADDPTKVLKQLGQHFTLSKYWEVTHNGVVARQNHCSFVRLYMGSQYTPGGFAKNLCEIDVATDFDLVRRIYASAMLNDLRLVHLSYAKFAFYDEPKRNRCAIPSLQQCPLVDMLRAFSRNEIVDAKRIFDTMLRSSSTKKELSSPDTSTTGADVSRTTGAAISTSAVADEVVQIELAGEVDEKRWLFDGKDNAGVRTWLVQYNGQARPGSAAVSEGTAATSSGNIKFSREAKHATSDISAGILAPSAAQIAKKKLQEEICQLK
ncbi:unnamed protein product [Amoebophrya sp. A120]|nr:unnamed protein product [Amoebophrya sp. A120]|eukprot:GSA120T00020547001.1